MSFVPLGKSLNFPPVSHADEEGLLAVGGDLSINRLVLAYSSGIFPWFSVENIPFWFAPDPRAVLFTDELHVSRSMARVLRQAKFRLTLDADFEGVLHHCSSVPRPGQEGTWITQDFKDAYINLHRMGLAHSVEAWQGDQLVGGIYGVAIKRMFCGESMFSLVPNASKAAFIALVSYIRKYDFHLLDCQIMNPHLESLGARDIPRSRFMVELQQGLGAFADPNCWPGWGQTRELSPDPKSRDQSIPLN